MKEKTKNILTLFLGGLVAVLLLLLLPLIVLVYLIGLPFRIRRYHQTPYYRDFKKKYELLRPSRMAVRLYNQTVGQNLPITYVCNGEYEYFVCEGEVWLCDWSRETVEEREGEWFFLLEGEEEYPMAMKTLLEEETALLKEEHRELPKKFLAPLDELSEEEEQRSLVLRCPYYHCIPSLERPLG